MLQDFQNAFSLPPMQLCRLGEWRYGFDDIFVCLEVVTLASSLLATVVA
ncbi:hypothetical protein QT313_15860 [Escherichia coli]|nr:hypothetical protein [Escherichia coli]MDM4883029.1 hypothetical protein [Escherichia coli]